MGCIYSHDGICEFFEPDEHDRSPQGCGENGECMVDDDPDPSESCDQYETDSGCFFCGADFNVDQECRCGETDEDDKEEGE